MVRLRSIATGYGGFYWPSVAQLGILSYMQPELENSGMHLKNFYFFADGVFLHIKVLTCLKMKLIRTNKKRVRY